MLRRRTKPVVAAKPNGQLWIAEDPFRGDRALLVDDDAVAPLSGDNHLSTALVDYLLQRSLQPSDLQDTTLVGSANCLHFFHQVNAKISIAPSDPNVAKSVENIRQRCSHSKDNKFEFVSPFCIDHHFVVVKIVFDLRSPDIFHEVSVYDSLIKGGRRNNSVHRNSPPAKYLRPFQQFIANFCSFGNPKCEVLLANPDLIMEKAVYRSCPLQQNGFDCGLFAFGCVLHLLKGLDVSADIFNQQHISKLRESLRTVFTLTDIGSDVPNPRELLSSSFLCSFFPLQSQNDYHEDVFLRLLADLPDNCNDIDAAPDDPNKALLPGLDDMPLNPRLGADPQPKPTTYRDNYFTSQFIEVPKEFEDMSKVDVAIDDYEESSGVRLIIARSRGTGSRLYFCASHVGCCFRDKFGRERGTVPIIYKQELSNPFHCGQPVPPKMKGRAPKKRVRDKLEESVDHVIEVKDGTPVSKDVIKAAANVQGVRASYNQAFRAIGRAVTKTQREKQQASFGLIMSYLHHFQLRNEDSTVRAESDADQRLQRLGICPGFMKHSLRHVRPVLSLDRAHLKSQWEENYGREGVVDKVATILERRWKNCAGFQVREVVKGGSQFDVFRPSRGASQPESNRLLNVKEQTCECGKWQEHGIPCIDAVAYYRVFQMKTMQYILDNHVSEHYKYETINELLKENIVPVSLDVLDQDGVTLPPNRTKRSSGRPRKKRIRKRSRFAHDPDKSPIVCSRCKKRGHNVKTCVAREQLEKQHPAELDLS